jgi:NTE family protein
VLQGGGALGADQAGVYQALAEHGYLPHWIAGISIGAMDGAIIAGSPEKERVERLRRFWERITESLALKPLLAGDWARGARSKHAGVPDRLVQCSRGDAA